MARQPTGRPRGRPRIHPPKDPNAPKRPVGRPRTKHFLDSAVNPPPMPAGRPGRPRNTEMSIPWHVTLPLSMSNQLDSLRGVFGPTRTSVLQHITRTFLDAVGEEGIRSLRRANQYGQVIEKRKAEQRAKRAMVALARLQIITRSGGWMDANGNELGKNE